MIKVFSGQLYAGVLAQSKKQPSACSFSYDHLARAEQAVSVTMPVRVESWLSPPHSLHPIFDMNLPEGFLKNWLEKVIPDCDSLKILKVTGPFQIGRLEYRETDRANVGSMPEENIQEILACDGAQDLFSVLLDKYARSSGISGVQPKVLIRSAEHTKISPDHKVSVKASTHILKTWDAQYPELARNEHFCLLAAQYAGLKTPYWEVSENGRFISVERFDLTPGKAYLGVEDFCVLAGYSGSKKYYGSYEQLSKIVNTFSGAQYLTNDLKSFYKIIALSVAVRNGDAHRKNFCMMYDVPKKSSCRLAPAFDIVTTTAYIPQDIMALTLNGSKRWPDRARLLAFGELHCHLSRQQCKAALEEVRHGVETACKELLFAARNHQAFSEIGKRMAQAWKGGLLTL